MLGSLKSRLVVRVYLAFGAVVVGLTLTTTVLQVISATHVGASTEIIGGLIRIAVAGLGIALVLGFILARRLAQPLADLIRVATAMRRGRYEERVAPIDVVELSSIGEALNVLGEEVSSRIALMSRDRAQLRSILSAMVEGIIAIDNSGRILFSNQAASRLLHNDMRLSRGEDFKNVPAINLLSELINDARQTSGLVTREVRMGPRENQTFIATKALPFANEDSAGRAAADGVVIVLHDITNVRRLERIRRDFVANVSHELKTPLTAIKGYVETLLGGAMEDPATNVRFLEKIDRNVERLSNLVQDILSLARIESHEDVDLVDATSVRIDWRSIVQAVASAHEDEAAAKGITMSVKLSDEPLVVAGEREAMRQILDNLVSNAIKYTPKSGQVWIDAHKTAGSECEIAVRDSGIGIPEKHLDRIFERFYRVDVARSREMGGTGLGLSIVKHLVAGLGGQVSVESKVGAGSTFTVHMKLASRQQEESSK
jgi:two-component system phosphate regulon sensor histidine kinase PhoR